MRALPNEPLKLTAAGFSCAGAVHGTWSSSIARGRSLTGIRWVDTRARRASSRKGKMAILKVVPRHWFSWDFGLEDPVGVPWGEVGLSSWRSDRLRESAVAALGLHPSPHDRRGYGNVVGSTLLWRLSPDQVAAAVGWRESLGPLRPDWLGGLSVHFILPFEDLGPEAWEYVALLLERLPFRMSPKHWKHWRLTKKRTSYVGHKISRPVLPAA
jgi:hypothetical protein